MGFYSVMDAACNKNRGYRSDDSAIRTEDKITVVSKMVQDD